MIVENISTFSFLLNLKMQGTSNDSYSLIETKNANVIRTIHQNRSQSLFAYVVFFSGSITKSRRANSSSSINTLIVLSLNNYTVAQLQAQRTKAATGKMLLVSGSIWAPFTKSTDPNSQTMEWGSYSIANCVLLIHIKRSKFGRN